jgi:hypothetical protein
MSIKGDACSLQKCSHFIARRKFHSNNCWHGWPPSAAWYSETHLLWGKGGARVLGKIVPLPLFGLNHMNTILTKLQILHFCQSRKEILWCPGRQNLYVGFSINVFVFPPKRKYLCAWHLVPSVTIYKKILTYKSTSQIGPHSVGWQKFNRIFKSSLYCPPVEVGVRANYD